METIGSNIRISEDERLTGIEGWLTFALIILCLNAAVLLLSTVMPFTRQPVTDEGRIGAIMSGVLFVYLVFVIVSFFKKKRRTRVLAIIFFGLMAVLSVLSLGVLLTHPTSDVSEIGGTIRGLIVSLPLTGYFIRSRRVKNTFVD